MPAPATLLERGDELDLLSGVALAARSRAGRAALIGGEAGAGKTTLLEALREQARTRGVATVSARCSEFEREHPFGVVRRLADSLLVRAGADRDRLLGGVAGALAPLLTDSAGGDDLPGPGEERRAAADHALFWLIANAAEDAPLLICVDDIHWADEPSLRFLATLAPRLGELPASLVVSVRDGEGHADGVHVARLAAAAERVALLALSQDAVAEIIRARVGEPDPAFARACLDVTRGNPFYVHELVGELARQRIAPTSRASAAIARLPLTSLSRAVMARLAGLSPNAPAVAQALAVLGDEVALALVARLAGLDEETAGRTADALARGGVLVRERSMSFSHAIVRHAVYEDLDPHRRSGMHRRAAGILRAAGAPVDAVAAQLALSDPAGDVFAVEALAGAGRGALAKGAPETAVALLRRAIVEQPGHPRADLHLMLGAALEETGEVAGAIEEFARAGALAADAGDDELEAQAQLRRGRALFATGRLEDGYRTLEAAADRLAASGSEQAVAVETALLAAGTALAEWRTRLLARGRRLRERIAEPTTPERRQALSFLALDAAMAAEPADVVVGLALRALDEGRLLSEQTATGPLLYPALLALTYHDEFERADAVFRAALEDARARGSIAGLGIASAYRSELLLRRGEVEPAVLAARDAIDRFLSEGTSLFVFLPFALASCLEALIELDDLEGAARLVADNGLGGDVARIGIANLVLYSRGRLRVAQGERRAGIADLRACGSRQLEWHSLNPATIPWRSELALALLEAGEDDEARELAAEELAIAQRVGAGRAVGIARRADGVARRDVDALRTSAADLDAAGAPLSRARTLLELGRLLLADGERDEALATLREAQGAAFACGGRLVARQADLELAAAGARNRRAALSGSASLTPSERRICEMAARGLTNREIAQELFVTLKTVESHLRNGYRKLGIGSRAELGRALSA